MKTYGNTYKYNNPWSFTTGTQKYMKEIDEAVQAMKKGMKAKVHCGPSLNTGLKGCEIDIEVIETREPAPSWSLKCEVFWFIPNLIGYARFALLFMALYIAYSPNYSWLFVIFYGLSQALDGVDGWAARKFD